MKQPEADSIGIIDYGMGNLHSAAKAFEHVAKGIEVVVSSDPEAIGACDRAVLPGVGAIRDCMSEIRRLGFDRLVKQMILEKPVLAICIGIQALMDFSEENNGIECIGAFPGKVRYFGDELFETDGSRLKVPHMGWNQVRQTFAHPLWQDIPDDSRFYFVHSYYVESAGFVESAELVESTGAGRGDESANKGSGDKAAHLAGLCHYGVDFAAALCRKNLFAVQFHPEKSQHAGLQLLKNFVAWDGNI